MKHGIGGVYQPKYRDAIAGELKQSAVWWIRYSHHGKKYRESSKSEVRAVATALLKKRIGEAGLNRPVTTAMRNTTLDDLSRLVIANYDRNDRDSTARQVDAFNWLRDYFGGDCFADEISSSRLAKYIAWRREQPDGRSRKRKGNVEYAAPPRIGCSTATINRELASLRRGFRLAAQHEPPLVARAPFIPLMRERNRRTGFFSYEEFTRLRDNLPDYLKPVMTCAFYTGWRTSSELLTRERRHIVDGMLVLEAGEGKTEQPRRFPLDVIPELRETLEAQLEVTHALELASGRVINLLFHHDGRAIVDYLPAWRKACEAAGLMGRIPHDFRRSAAKNLTAAGVDPFTTMQLVGWSDIGMLRRYNIVDEQALKMGVGKLTALIDAQKAAASKVVAIRG
jgi:integrase